MSAVVLFLYREVWWGVDGKLLWFGWDVPESYWPDLSFYAGSLHHGELPLWNPYGRGGFPFYGDTVYGAYYPLTWGLVAPGAIAGSMPPWVGQLKSLLHWVMGASFLYAYLRTRRLHWAAAGFGGVVWIVSVPMIIHKASALNWNLVWAPLVWIATDRLIDRAGEKGWWRRAGLLAATLGIAGAAGPPPGFFYLLLTCGGYGAFRVALKLWDFRGDRAALKRHGLWIGRDVGVAAAWSVALLLIMVVPAMAIADLSLTRGASRSLNYALNTALPVAPTLRGLVAPSAGKLDSYFGMLPIMLALVGLVIAPRKDRGAAILFTVLALFMTVMSFGGTSALLPWLVKHVPGFGFFREPNRYKCVAALCLAVPAAHGLDALLSGEQGRRRRRWIAVAASAAVVIGLALYLHGSHELPAKHRPGAGIKTTITIVLFGAALFAVVAGRWRRISIGAAVVVTGLAYYDVTSFALRNIRVTEAPTDDREDLRHLDGLADVTREWRVYDEFVMEQRPGSRLRIRNFRGYPSVDPFADRRYGEVLRRLPKDPELLAAFNVRYVLHGRHHRSGTHKNFIKKPPDAIAPKRFRRIDAKRFEVIDPAPQVQWYARVDVVENRHAALDAVVAMEKELDTRLAAVVERDELPSEVADTLNRRSVVGGTPVVGTLESFEANRIAFEINAPHPGLVVLNEKMSPGWTVTVDGVAAAPLRANFLLRAVMVAAGKHRVVWSYWPPRYTWLLLLWLLGLAALLGVWIEPKIRAWRGASALTHML